MSASASTCRPRRKLTDVIKKRPAGRASDTGSVTGAAGRMSDAEVDAAWRALLEETLPPDKQEALMEAYREESDPQMRYNMLLEFSSYLRQSGAGESQGYDDRDAVDPDDDKYRAKPQRPRRRQQFDDDDANLCWEITRVLLIVGGIMLAVVGAAMYLNGAFDGGSMSLGSSVSHVAMESDDA